MYLAPRGDTESASVIEAALLTGTITGHSQSTAQRHPLPGWKESVFFFEDNSQCWCVTAGPTTCDLEPLKVRVKSDLPHLREGYERQNKMQKTKLKNAGVTKSPGSVLVPRLP